MTPAYTIRTLICQFSLECPIMRETVMEDFGDVVIHIVMACAVLGALASIRTTERGLGKEFIQGIYSIGPIFVPVAGIMASIPFLKIAIRELCGPAFELVGADPAMAATTFIAVDMGGYKLAMELADGTENWIMAMVVGYMSGATIIFSIPVGLAMLQKSDHKYMALGIMAGVLSIPIGVATSSVILALSSPNVRGVIATDGPFDVQLALTLGQVFTNLIPLVLFVVVLAVGLRFFPNVMIKLFMLFGRGLDAALKLVLVACIVEHFTHLFSEYLGVWGFDPIIWDVGDVELRALEISGYIGIMLAGAFPMVYLIQKYLSRPMDVVGRKLGLETAGAAGMLATVANILAMFRLVKDMRPKDKVLIIAFAVCSAFLFGDHLAFTANFQKTLILPIMVGKLTGGLCGFALAYWLSVPKALELESQEQNPITENAPQ